jgi:ribosome-associated translation inhibitor RaiA
LSNELTVHVLGLVNDELCFQKEIGNAVVRTEKSNRKTQTHLDEITVVIKRQQHGETSVKYLVTIRAWGEEEQFLAKAVGDSLHTTIDELCKNFGKALRKEKHPRDTPKMWGHFLR